jgi:hypothetical protein
MQRQFRLPFPPCDATKAHNASASGPGAVHLTLNPKSAKLAKLYYRPLLSYSDQQDHLVAKRPTPTDPRFNADGPGVLALMMRKASTTG